MKNVFWGLPIISTATKERIYYTAKKIIRSEGGTMKEKNINILDSYRKQILNIPTVIEKKYYKDIIDIPYHPLDTDSKLIAYYLPQMYPTPENDKWWGKGVTEWNNVSRAVPQFLGHYQPRLPGELGFYDLRLKENILRQIELAKLYGVYAFCFYYYWFDGKRLLDKPLDMFVNAPEIKFPFCLCWANESWTKGFFGSSREIIMKQNDSVESYRNFIHDIVPYFGKDNYIKIKNKNVLLVYKPQDIPDSKDVIKYWREYCKKKGVGDLYIIGCWKSNQKINFLELGFDATAEFQAGAIEDYCKKINDKVDFVNETYYGAIYNYQDIIEKKIYEKNFKRYKMYSAVMPMWDNTPRKNNKGSMIFDGSTPDLYKQWLKAAIKNNKKRTDLDEDIIFVNAWNEWGEGAYLEPDRRYGYAYLQATKDAIEESRI
jgi:lipopolysaccharide biosynthesis protein